jgi:dTDP-glucose 4,6-dehydratase
MKNIDLIHKLITITVYLQDRPKATSLELINYVSDRAGHDFRYGIDLSKLQKELGCKDLDNFNENFLKKLYRGYIKQ